MMDEGYVLERIEELCDKEGWSHYVLAKRSGISQSTISNMFSRTNQPTFITVAKICDAFGITMAQFFEHKNFDYPEKPLKYKHIRRISD